MKSRKQKYDTYALLVSDDEGKSWRIHDDTIQGRDAADALLDEMKKKQPTLTWKVYPRPVADALMYGFRLGRSMCHRCVDFPRRAEKKKKKPCSVVNE